MHIYKYLTFCQNYTGQEIGVHPKSVVFSMTSLIQALTVFILLLHCSYNLAPNKVPYES